MADGNGNGWAIAGGAGSVVSSLISGLFGNSQQSKQNKFAAEQAELDRQFQAEQAQLANEFTTSERLASQQWEEDWYNNYSSPQAMVQQYEDAGLNPALMYGQAGASTGETPSAPSGSSGAYASGSKASPLQGLSSLDYLSFAVDAFSKITNAIKTSRESRHQQMENDVFDLRLGMELSKHDVDIAYEVSKTDEVKANIQKIFADADLSRAEIKDLCAKAEVYKSEIHRNEKLNGLSDAEISRVSAETVRVRQIISQDKDIFPIEKLSKQLDVDEKQAQKAVDFFIPEMLAKYDSEYWLTIAKESSEYANRRLTDAEVEKVKSEAWYQDFCNNWAKFTGKPFDMSQNVWQFISRIPELFVSTLTNNFYGWHRDK